MYLLIQGPRRGQVSRKTSAPGVSFSDSLRAKMPVPGLFLTSQDAATPGVTGAMIGGVRAASTYEAKVRSYLL